ncbi:MAG: hypothetical protein ACW98Y_12780 [Candidatus Thorarchaeota archaeon]
MMELSHTKTRTLFLEEMSPHELGRFIREKITNFDCYENATTEIQKAVSEGHPNPKRYLHRLVWKVCKHIMEQRLPKNLSYYSECLNNDLSGKEFPWSSLMWLVGPEVNERIDIDGVVLEPPSEENLMINRRVDKRSYWEDNKERIVPSSVLRIGFLARNQMEFNQDIRRLFMSLRLFRLGYTDYSRMHTIPDSIIENEFITTTPKIETEARFLVRKNDEEDLRFHLFSLTKLIPDEFMKPSFVRDDALSIAYGHYEEALKMTDPHRQVAQGIIGLEGLFLDPKHRGPKKKDLANRILDSEIDCTDLSFDEIVESYNIRNDLFHTTPLSPERISASFELTGKILECLRKTIIHNLGSTS